MHLKSNLNIVTHWISLPILTPVCCILLLSAATIVGQFLPAIANCMWLSYMQPCSKSGAREGLEIGLCGSKQLLQVLQLSEFV